MKEWCIRKGLQKCSFSVVIFMIFFLVLLVIIIWGRVIVKPEAQLGYCLLNCYLLIPAVAFICSVLLGVKNVRIKWIAPLIFGSSGGLLPGAIFHSLEVIFLLVILVPSILGITIGMNIAKMRK